MFELHKLNEKTFSLSILDDQKNVICHLQNNNNNNNNNNSSSSNHARPLLKNWSKMKIVKKWKLSRILKVKED